MRIVTKTNLALLGVVAVSALLNFGVLEGAIMPRFLDIETQSAERDRSRAIEAIQVQADQVAASSRDYAFWDDSYAFAQGRAPDYDTMNASADSLKALNVNYLLVVDPNGHVTLDRGFDYKGGESRPIQLMAPGGLPDGHPFRLTDPAPQSRQGLLRTEQGIVTVGYSPVLTTLRTGPVAGTLAFGRILDIEALRTATKVDFDLLPLEADAPSTDALTRGSDRIETRTVLRGIDGEPLAVLVSRTDRLISSAGRQAIWTAMSLLVLGGAFLIVTLAVLLRRIVIARIEAMRRHLVTVASTGSLDTLPADHRGDELSDTIGSFNTMASQLAELREALRRQDYSHGAADQAAGILHNVRNAVSPISTVTWDLLRDEDAPWRQNFTKAVVQLADRDLAPERAEKLNQFITLSAPKLVEESAKRRANLEALGAMVRHVDRILKDEDAVSHGERKVETIDLASCAAAATAIVHGKANVAFVSELQPELNVVGHRIALEQVLANLLLNAAEAITAKGAGGSISLTAHDVQHNGAPALDIRITDDGDGIPADQLERVFARGFSTRRERSSGLGLHWCANAVNAMKGRLYAESGGSGCGATLHLILPRAATAMKEAA